MKKGFYETVKRPVKAEDLLKHINRKLKARFTYQEEVAVFQKSAQDLMKHHPLICQQLAMLAVLEYQQVTVTKTTGEVQ